MFLPSAPLDTTGQGRKEHAGGSLLTGCSAIEEKPNLLLGVKSEVRGSKIRA